MGIGGKAGFGVVLSCFVSYFFLIIVAPAMCGWCEPSASRICRVLPYPMRTLLLSQFVFVELLGLAFIVGGLLILFHPTP
jgi:hypothetical protein